MPSQSFDFARVVVLAAHPDDESIACAGLLQRATTALVVFAVDGAPPHYGFEKKFASLRNYSDTRFQEAYRALQMIPGVSVRRLARPDGKALLDQHLFLDLPSAFTSLCQIVLEFAPTLFVSHAFEGGHVDHDACHVLARQASAEFGLAQLEFPLYWQRQEDGKDVFQQFRETGHAEFVLQLTPQELNLKRQMFAEYHTQQGITSVFTLDPERFRPVDKERRPHPTWPTYPFENRRSGLTSAAFLTHAGQFEQSSGHGFSRAARAARLTKL
jgi:N-acetylglucosamine malate deacetylase 2